MFPRLTSVSIALIVILGIVASANADCGDICCQTVQDVDADSSTGWEGSDCFALLSGVKCPYTKFCCNDFSSHTGVATECTHPA